MIMEIDNLTVRYRPPDRPPVDVLRGVTVALAAGEVVALVGESGSGKSTSARAGIRLLPESAEITGRIRTCGTDVMAADAAALRALRAAKVAFIHQDPRASLNPVRTIGDAVTERLVHGNGVDRKRAWDTGLELLTSVGLTEPERRMNQYPHELSGGMLQRVVIAGALTADPELVIADEATSALDVTTQAEVLAIIREQLQARGLGVLFITHDLHLAAAYCDRVYVLHRGTVVEEVAGGDLFAGATHEYTRSLLAATPALRHGAGEAGSR